MSRTFRGKDRERLMRGKRVHRRVRSNHQNFGVSNSRVYKNATRVMCGKYGGEKWLFKSFDAALVAIKYNNKIREETCRDKKDERVYYCKACNGYHLTSMNRDEWEERKKRLFVDYDPNYKEKMKENHKKVSHF